MTEAEQASRISAIRSSIEAQLSPVLAWLDEPENVRRAAFVALPLLVVLGLLLPPISIVTRVRTIGYTHIKPGRQASVPSNVPGTQLTFNRTSVKESSHFKLRVHESNDLPRGVDDLPSGRVLLSTPLELDVQGVPPSTAILSMPLAIRSDDVPYVDPFGWDGDEWRWLSPRFDSSNWARVTLPLDEFIPEYIVFTRAGETPTEVSVTLLPPPATVPAVVAELPTLEMRAYGIQDGDGRVEGEAFTMPSASARRFGVVDNLHGTRVRTDLVANVLIRPGARQRHRQAIADIVRRDDLDGIVLDYHGVPSDLQAEFVEFVVLLADDLDRLDAELVVVVPMPQPNVSGWSSGAYDWRAIGAAADGLRVRLPDDAPLGLERLDEFVRWALTQVDRGHLQLAVPARGRDIVKGVVTPISFGEALRQVIDLAASDAPDRISPGQEVTIDLPTTRASAMERDADTGVWRFNAWDRNRRQHTIWLLDAAGHKPVFDIASRYRLGAVVLDGVSADLDPALWNMLRTYANNGVAAVSPTDYRLRWQLTDDRGQVLQETTHPLGGAKFSFAAPAEQGTYRLLVNLISADGRPVALGEPADVRVAPPPPPTPLPTMSVFYVAPTPMQYVTAPAPADEQRLIRTPVRVIADATATPTSPPEDRTPGTPGTPGTPDTPTVTETPHVPQARVAVAAAVMRSGPGIGYDVVTDLRAGDELEVIGRAPSARWVYVRIIKTGVEGWVLSDVLELNVSLSQMPVMVLTTPTATP